MKENIWVQYDTPWRTGKKMGKGKFEAIYKDLKEKIEDGTYGYNAMLPSEYQLIEIYECSRNTVRRALSMLSEDGYVQSIRGKGVQVIYEPTNYAQFTVGGIESFAETAKRNNLKSVTKVAQFTEMVVDESTARRTGFPIGEEVFYIQRVRFLDGVPMILDINVFLKSEMPDLTPEIAVNSIYSYLENNLGMQIVTSKRRITAERATQADAKYLDLKDYDFMAVITGQTFNSNGTMFEWTQSRHRPDYFVFYDTAVRKR